MQLRYYQHEAVEALFQFYSKPRKLDVQGKPERKNPLVCLPTGTGKSLIIAEFFRRAFAQYPDTRVIMATHVKTLIEQNAAKMLEAWPLAPLGIYSAGLKQKDFVQPIIFGGVKSLAGKYPIFGYRDFLVIDEAHLVGDDGLYLKFIGELLLKNPFLKIIGLSATAYRLGLGCLTNGKIFTHIIYDLCNIDGFNRLIAEGYLCPLIPPSRMPDGTPLIQIDTSGVGMSKGEFIQSELEAAIKTQDITSRIIQQAVTFGANRKCWLTFATGIDDAEETGECLNSFGIDTVVLHSKKTAKENDEALAAWKAGEVRSAVSMGMLTTGVDNPSLDLIIHKRPTMSTGLWVQTLGRGTRPNEGKSNCLVLDFAGNTRRLGPINDPVIPKLKTKGPAGDAPVRICSVCSCYNHASARFCFACGVEFTFANKLSVTASNEALLKSDFPQVEMIGVDRVIYSKHKSNKSGKSSVKVSYYCGLRTFYEWISVESAAPATRHRSRDWFRQRFNYGPGDVFRWLDSKGAPSNVPATDQEVLTLMGNLRMPRQIRVWLNKQPYPEVLAAEF